jgi:hypothetical protein
VFVTVLTPLIVAGYVALGAASALGGAAMTWLFHHVVKAKQLRALDERVEELEK